MNKKKVILVIASLRGGGAERVMSNMANYWAERGVEVFLVTLDSPDGADRYPINQRIKRFSLSYCPSSNSVVRIYGQLKRIVKLRRLITVERPDAVLSFMTSTNVMTILAARGTGVRCVVSERTDPSKHEMKLIWVLGQRFIYRHADLIVAQTQRVKEWLLSKTKGSIQIIPNFIGSVCDLERSETDSTVIAVGRLSFEKGFDILIRAFSLVIENYPDWQLIILGDGPERVALESLASTLRIDPYVRFLGHVSNPEKWLISSSISVQPSRYEGFPNALLEAMAQGLAVIATNPAGEMLINDGVNGILVAADDIGKLAESLAELMGNPALRVKLGDEAKKVRTIYGQEKIMALWDNVVFFNRTINR